MRNGQIPCSMNYRCFGAVGNDAQTSEFTTLFSGVRFSLIITAVQLTRPAIERSEYLRTEFRLRMAEYTPEQLVFTENLLCTGEVRSVDGVDH